MEEKNFWQSLAEIGAGIVNNKTNANAAIAQSQNQSTALAQVARFGIMLLSIYLAGKFVVSLFKRR